MLLSMVPRHRQHKHAAHVVHDIKIHGERNRFSTGRSDANGELLGVDADHVAFGEHNLEILNNGAVGRQPEFHFQIFESVIVYGGNGAGADAEGNAEKKTIRTCQIAETGTC
jgi:hypothetical protein